MEGYLLVLVVGLAAGAVSGVIGTGSSTMLLPALVYTFGPKQAVPVMAVAAVMANVARVLAWWRLVDWRAVAAYALPGAPAAMLGARTMWAMPERLLDVCLGVFFIVMVPGRHALRRRRWTATRWHLALIGAGVGFLTGIVLSTGPLSVPAFAAYGLTGGAFLGTEAASSISLFLSKVGTFTQVGALPWSSAVDGLIVGASLMAGTFLGKRFVLGLSERMFERLLDGIMVFAGLTMLWTAWHAPSGVAG